MIGSGKFCIGIGNEWSHPAEIILVRKIHANGLVYAIILEGCYRKGVLSADFTDIVAEKFDLVNIYLGDFQAFRGIENNA